MITIYYWSTGRIAHCQPDYLYLFTDNLPEDEGFIVRDEGRLVVILPIYLLAF